MRKAFFILFFVFVFLSQVSFAKTLKGNVSLSDNLPKAFFGSWAVTSLQTYSNNPEKQIVTGIDYWNIYRQNDVLTLENIVTRARASITINSIKDNTVTFTRKAISTNVETIETPIITIYDENFVGTDKIVVKKYKNNGIIETDVVEFLIMGTKIGGDSVQKLINKTT